MAKKRGNGEGSIAKYKDIWRARIMVGTNEQGKPIRKEFYGKTRKEVTEKLEVYKVQKYLGNTAKEEKITVQEWYYQWLFEIRSKDLKPTSFERYESLYRKHILGSSIANIKLKDLKYHHLTGYYDQLVQSGVSIKTAKMINTRFNTCFKEAVKRELIIKNYCGDVSFSKTVDKKDLEVLTLDEQNKFIDHIKGHKLEVLFLVAIGTGLRIGEIQGLKWSDIDFSNCNLSVNRTLQRVCLIDKDGKRTRKIIEQCPKTSNALRVVPIPNHILLKLQDHKTVQDNLRLKLGKSFNVNNYVFCNETGDPIDDKRPGRNLTSILKNLNIKPIKFHGLRKTYATRLFENDVPAKTVQVLLGHSDVGLTLNTYTQVMENKKLEAIEKIDTIFNV